MIHYPKVLEPIFAKLIFHGAKPVIVGGYIRDSLLGFSSKDIDVEVYLLDSYETLQNILEEFGDVNIVGKSFGVCKLTLQDLDLDFSLPRKDHQIAKGHKGFEVTTLSHLDYYSAFLRRDFTINAIGYVINTKEFIDPFHGMSDLKSKFLRYVNETSFAEDPLRVFRAMQFSARFELTIDPSLLLLCKGLVKQKRVEELSKERIFEEMKKLLLKAKKPSLGIIFLKEIGAFYYFKGLLTLSLPALERTLASLDVMACQEVAENKTKLTLMLALLLFELSKDEQLTLLNQLTSDSKLLKEVPHLLLSLQKIKKEMNDYELLKLASSVELKKVFTLAKSLKAFHAYSIDKKETRAEKLGILEFKKEEIIKGRDLKNLGLSPSKEFATILEDAYEAQLRGEFATLREGEVWLKSYLESKSIFLLSSAISLISCTAFSSASLSFIS